MESKRRVISLLVDNQSGVLARVSNLFCRRGFNIDSLTVSATNDPAVSRITVPITSDDKALKQLILKKLESARADYELLRATITHTADNDTEDTSPTFKVLEEGATTLSKEESGRLAAHQMKFIRNLEMALVRIENKTYGICKTTGKLIPKERLMKVPHATECIEAKEGRR